MQRLVSCVTQLCNGSLLFLLLNVSRLTTSDVYFDAYSCIAGVSTEYCSKQLTLVR